MVAWHLDGSQRILPLGDIVHREVPYLGTCYKVTWEMLEEDVHSQCLVSGTRLEKLLREVSSSWALLVALSYQNQGLGKMPSAGARQQKKTHHRSPVQKTLHPAGLWETGRKNCFFLWVLPVSSTGITSYQTSQVNYLHSPPPSS